MTQGITHAGATAAAIGLLITMTVELRSQAPSSAASFAITNVTVIDTAGGASRPDMTVIVSGDRIKEVGRSRSVRLAQNTQHIDGRGKYLIPGLWDVHFHWYHAGTLPLLVANGVTGARVMWGVPVHHQWRKEIATGTLVGPRMVIGSALLDGPKPVWKPATVVATADDARQAVVKAKADGAEFIKIYEKLPRAAFFAIADESKRQGLPFVGHVPTSVTVAEAVLAGMKSIEHDRFMLAATTTEQQAEKLWDAAYSATDAGFPNLAESRPFLRLAADSYSRDQAQALVSHLKKSGTWIDPTLGLLRLSPFPHEPRDQDPRLKYIPSPLRKSWLGVLAAVRSEQTTEDVDLIQRLHHQLLEVVKMIRDAGVGILAGTDSGNPFCFPGFSLHDELRLLVDAGLTPLEALQAATLNPARFFEKEKDLGTVAAGKFADLVLLDADPLAAITNTTRIDSVVANGRLFRKADLADLLAKAEAAANQGDR